MDLFLIIKNLNKEKKKINILISNKKTKIGYKVQIETELKISGLLDILLFSQFRGVHFLDL